MSSMYGYWPQSHVICCGRYIVPPPPVEIPSPTIAGRVAILDKHEPEEFLSKTKGVESAPELDSAALPPSSI